jgi:hypothetical protein
VGRINVDEVYAGDNMNAAYVKEHGPLTLKIAHAEVKTFGGENGEPENRKIVLSFEGEDKSLALNVTNKTILRDAWGPYADEWVGRTIRIFNIRTAFKGKPCDGVQVEPSTDVAAARGGGGNGHANAQPMGAGPAAKLGTRLSESGRRIEDLRVWLGGKGMDASGEPHTWPAAWMGQIAEWFKTPVAHVPIDDDDIPF